MAGTGVNVGCVDNEWTMIKVTEHDLKATTDPQTLQQVS
jgi:hypothetical protein